MQNSTVQENQDNDYRETGGQVAIVTDKSSVMDGGFNQSAYEGAQTYAQAAGISYSYYSASSNTREAYEEVVLSAAENNAKLIICAGPCFEQAVGSLQEDYKDICFLLLDGVPKDASGNPVSIAPNVHCITYHEEEAGYLAGYMAVLAGYEKLGFMGGEETSCIQKYGYGYLQGIDDAAAFLGISEKISVDYWYVDTVSLDDQIEDISREWYEAGTQIIFACGGTLYQSVLASAEVCGGRLIGVDMTQNGISEVFFAFAVKGVKSSVIDALDEFYAYGGAWPEEMSGKTISYGADKKSVGVSILDDTGSLDHDLTDEYSQVLADLKDGKIPISDETDIQPETTISVIYHNK